MIFYSDDLSSLVNKVLIFWFHMKIVNSGSHGLNLNFMIPDFPLNIRIRMAGFFFKPEVPALGLLYPPSSVSPVPSVPSQIEYLLT